MRRKQDAEFLLYGRGAGNYEVAYEKHGIHFDPTGVEIKSNGHTEGVMQEAVAQVAAGVPVETVNAQLKAEASPRPKMSIADRMLKAREARNRNRIAKGLPPIEFKS